MGYRQPTKQVYQFSQSVSHNLIRLTVPPRPPLLSYITEWIKPKMSTLRKDSALEVCRSVGSEAIARWLNFCLAPLGLVAGRCCSVFSADKVRLLRLYIAAAKSVL